MNKRLTDDATADASASTEMDQLEVELKKLSSEVLAEDHAHAWIAQAERGVQNNDLPLLRLALRKLRYCPKMKA